MATSTNFRKKIGLILSLFMLGFVAFYLFTAVTGFPYERVHIDPNSHTYVVITEMRISQFVGKASSFFYFTNLAGLITVITLFIYFLPSKKQLIANHFVLSVTVYQVFVFVFFWSFLAPFNDWLQQPRVFAIELTMHGLIPILTSLLFLSNCASFEILDRKQTKETWIKRCYWWTLSFPLGYYLMALIFYLSVQGKASIYPFLNFYRPFSYHLHWSLVLLIDFGVFFGSMLGILFLTKTTAILTIKKLELKISKQF